MRQWPSVATEEPIHLMFYRETVIIFLTRGFKLPGLDYPSLAFPSRVCLFFDALS